MHARLATVIMHVCLQSDLRIPEVYTRLMGHATSFLAEVTTWGHHEAKGVEDGQDQRESRWMNAQKVGIFLAAGMSGFIRESNTCRTIYL